LDILHATLRHFIEQLEHVLDVARSSQRAKDAVARVDLRLDVELVVEAVERVESAEGRRAAVWTQRARALSAATGECR